MSTFSFFCYVTPMTRISLVSLTRTARKSLENQMHTRLRRILNSRFALEHRYSAVAMNNCLVFGAFLLMIYSNDLVWDFAGESIGLLVTSCVIGTCGFSTSRLFDM